MWSYLLNVIFCQIKGADAEAAFVELANQSAGVKRKASSERDLHDKISHLEQDLKHRELTMKDLKVNFKHLFASVHYQYSLAYDALFHLLCSMK